MKIRFWDPSVGYKKIKDEVLSELDRIYSKGDLILREDVDRFENNVANFTGTKYAIGVNSGTMGLLLAYLACGIKEGDEVITVSHTYVSTISEIEHAGATPVLVDIGDDGLMDMDDVERKITPRTKAIVPVHLEGKVCDMDRLLELQKKYNNQFVIIEDACQAWGAEYKGKRAGSFGKAGVFSCYPAKIFGAYADAGVVVTDDEEIARELKQLRFHYYIGGGYRGGTDDINDMRVRYGYNGAICNQEATILNIKFKYLLEHIKRREEIAEMYLNGINNDRITLPIRQEGRVWQDFVIRCEERDKLALYLTENGIEILGHNLLPNHAYRSLFDISLANTEKYISTQIRIPCNPDLTDEEVNYIIKKINEF